MKKPIVLPRSEGMVSRQAHVDVPDGSYEREVGREGFFGAATHFYHRHPPTSWTGIEGPLRPRAFDTNQLDQGGEATEIGPLSAPVLAANAFASVRLWRCRQSMSQLARNADGDDLLFVHQGCGELMCDYGHLSFRDGDYVLIPRGTQWRIEVANPATLLMIEATGHGYQLPDRGSLGQHAVFDPGMLDTPKLDGEFKAQTSEESSTCKKSWQVRVKARGKLSTISYPHNPLDAIGWKGTLCPVRINWRDIRPVVSARYHIPPSVHTTFVGHRFVVCTFCPRPIETEPGALKVPFYHSNDDFDELIFYHQGKFFSRDQIHPGMVTYHPAGLPHGPHPKAYEASLVNPQTHTDEVAVMIDTRDPVALSPIVDAIEQSDYVDSWQGLIEKSHSEGAG